MILGYNTNGFAHHRLDDAIQILTEIGYRSIALTLEHDQLDPPTRAGVAGAVGRIRSALGRQTNHPHSRTPREEVSNTASDSVGKLRLTIETGSRFLLNPRLKHQPTLISAHREDRQKRTEFLLAAIEIAAETGADSVSLWSGAPDDNVGEPELLDRLVEQLNVLLNFAKARGVRLAFEPEPGMYIDTMARFELLHTNLNHPSFGLTLDIGHVHCLADGDLAAHLRRWRDNLWNVHIEDMRRGVHEHLMFGEGEVDFLRVFAPLREISYEGPIHVELSRHSHDSVNSARRSFEFLSRMVQLNH